MIPRLAFYLLVIGIVLQITAIKKRDLKLVKIGFALLASTSIAAGYLLLQIPNFTLNIFGFFLLVLAWLNWIFLQRLEKTIFSNYLEDKIPALVKVVGRKKAVTDYFKYYGLEMPELCHESEDRYFCTQKVYLDYLPQVKILNGFVLDINPESAEPGKWQFKFGTKFGEDESRVRNVIDFFIKYEDDDGIHHHFEFDQGKILVHLIDFPPIFWRPAG